MKHYKNANGDVFGFEDDGSQDHLIVDMVEMTDAEFAEHSKPELPSYQELRQADLPSIGDQMDMQYWDAMNGTTLWKDMITSVKTKHPK